MKYFSGLLQNSRFYILAFNFLASVLVLSYVRAHVVSDQLFYIRLEQIYGLIAVIYLYLAIIMTPLSKLFGSRGVMSYGLFARRAIGVSAAYFAFLHFYIALTKQLGGIGSFNLLPGRFKVSVILGILSLIIVLLMAVTSFDKAIDIMTFKRWKQLHRFVYAAGILVIIHVWLIGTHIANSATKFVASSFLLLLFGLEALRISAKLAKTTSYSRKRLAITILVFALFSFGLGVITRLAQNYHSQHHAETSAELAP